MCALSAPRSIPANANVEARLSKPFLDAVRSVRSTGPEQRATSLSNRKTTLQQPAAAPDSRFAWYMEGRTPAGHTAIVRHGDGRVTSESFIHWNNREWRVASELQLDEHGLPLTQRITGTTPYHAPIDESFVRTAGRAQWKTVGEQGELPVDGREFYLAAESGAFESLPALVRAALR